MKRNIMMGLGLALMLGLNGCAMGRSAVSPIGSHGKESTLSDNKIEGLYLFKIETNQNNITVHSGGDAKVGM